MNNAPHKTDEAVDRVMAGLRDCDPPVGMGRRIVERVEGRISATAWAQLRQWMPIWMAAMPRRTWTFASVSLASVLIIALTIFPITQHSRFRNGLSKEAAANQTAVVSSRGKMEIATGGSQSKKSGLTGADHPVSLVKVHTRMRREQGRSAVDAVALAEMRAPSHPAPPEPLTQQEKLLLRVVHSGDPQVMAMLNSTVRAREEAESDAEFQKFIGSSAQGDRE